MRIVQRLQRVRDLEAEKTENARLAPLVSEACLLVMLSAFILDVPKKPDPTRDHGALALH